MDDDDLGPQAGPVIEDKEPNPGGVDAVPETGGRPEPARDLDPRTTPPSTTTSPTRSPSPTTRSRRSPRAIRPTPRRACRTIPTPVRRPRTARSSRRREVTAVVHGHRVAVNYRHLVVHRRDVGAGGRELTSTGLTDDQRAGREPR